MISYTTQARWQLQSPASSFTLHPPTNNDVRQAVNHLSNRNGEWMQGRGYRPSDDECSSRFCRIVLGIFAYGVIIVALVAVAWPIISWAAARIGL